MNSHFKSYLSVGLIQVQKINSGATIDAACSHTTNTTRAEALAHGISRHGIGSQIGIFRLQHLTSPTKYVDRDLP